MSYTGISQDERSGINFSYVGNYNGFFLNVHEDYTSPITGTIDQKSILRAPDRFPEIFMESYQLGFLNQKKSWHDFRFSFLYMPETKKENTEIKIEDLNWQELGTHTISKNMELYMVNLSHIYRINLIAHFIYLNLGFGGGGGVIRWPDYYMEGSSMFFISYYAYPLGGLELKFGKHLSITGEYHYQYGNSLSQKEGVTGGDITWDYHLEGHEIGVGLNIYF